MEVLHRTQTIPVINTAKVEGHFPASVVHTTASRRAGN